jgi:hypothetical protein
MPSKSQFQTPPALLTHIPDIESGSEKVILPSPLPISITAEKATSFLSPSITIRAGASSDLKHPPFSVSAQEKRVKISTVKVIIAKIFLSLYKIRLQKTIPLQIYCKSSVNMI